MVRFLKIPVVALVAAVLLGFARSFRFRRQRRIVDRRAAVAVVIAAMLGESHSDAVHRLVETEASRAPL